MSKERGIRSDEGGDGHEGCASSEAGGQGVWEEPALDGCGLGAALLIFATNITLLGALPFVGIFVCAVAATITGLTLWSGAHDETLLSGHNHHPGAPPDRGGDWASVGWGDGAGGDDGGGGGGGW